MRWWFQRHSNTTVERVVAAFPARYADDAAQALRALPVADNEPTSTDAIELSVSGERVRIPYRVYFQQPSVEALEALDSGPRLIVAALLTRHHDGHVRERWLGELLQSHMAWVPAFVAPLLGENVVEIAGAVHRRLTHGSQEYEEFARNNPEFCRKTSARMINYWALYYRGAFPRFSDYPGYQIAKILGVWRGRPPRDPRAR